MANITPRGPLGPSTDVTTAFCRLVCHSPTLFWAPSSPMTPRNSQALPQMDGPHTGGESSLEFLLPRDSLCLAWPGLQQPGRTTCCSHFLSWEKRREGDKAWASVGAAAWAGPTRRHL